MVPGAPARAPAGAVSVAVVQGRVADRLRRAGPAGRAYHHPDRTSEQVDYARSMGWRATLYGIADSPVGLAAWLLDHDDADGQPASAVGPGPDHEHHGRTDSTPSERGERRWASCREGSAGGVGRRGPAGRVPPGQYLTDDFPVLSAGPTPTVPLDDWRFTISGEVDEPRHVDLGRVPRAADRAGDARHPLRHQVVKLDTDWEGRLAGHAPRRRRDRAEYVLAHCYGGYTTNLPLEDLTGGKAWVAYAYDGEPLEPEHGGPARLLVPHLYFWKSAKWVRGLELAERRTSRASGSARLPQLR